MLVKRENVNVKRHLQESLTALPDKGTGTEPTRTEVRECITGVYHQGCIKDVAINSQERRDPQVINKTK